MTTAVLKTTLPIPALSVPAIRYNRFAIAAAVCALLFVSYFIVPHGGIMNPMFRLSVIYVVFMPLAAFVFSALAVRQVSVTGEKGRVLGYASLALTSLYFATALAIPVVLVGFYILYAYVL